METEYIKDKPHFEDGCSHGSTFFVGSGSYMDKVGKNFQEVFIDVYVYPDNFEKFHVCIRYGNEPQEYYSPGSLYMFVESAGRHSALKVYKEALDIMKHKGFLIFRHKGVTLNQEKVNEYLDAIKVWNMMPHKLIAMQLYERLTKTHGIADDEALDIINTAMQTALNDERRML